MADKKRRERMRLKVVKRKVTIFPNIGRRSQRAQCLPNQPSRKAIFHGRKPRLDLSCTSISNIGFDMRKNQPSRKAIFQGRKPRLDLSCTPISKTGFDMRKLLKRLRYHLKSLCQGLRAKVWRLFYKRQSSTNVAHRRCKPRIALSSSSITVFRKKRCLKVNNRLKPPKPSLQDDLFQDLNACQSTSTVWPPRNQSSKASLQDDLFEDLHDCLSTVTLRPPGNQDDLLEDVHDRGLSTTTCWRPWNQLLRRNVKPQSNVTPSLSGSSGIGGEASNTGLRNSVSKFPSSESVHVNPGCSAESLNNNRGLNSPMKVSGQNDTSLHFNGRGNNRKRSRSGDDIIPSLERTKCKKCRTEESMQEMQN